VALVSASWPATGSALPQGSSAPKEFIEAKKASP